jgi:hypothetical protein
MRPSTLIGKVLPPNFYECETARAGISKKTGETIRKASLVRLGSIIPLTLE